MRTRTLNGGTSSRNRTSPSIERRKKRRILPVLGYSHRSIQAQEETARKLALRRTESHVEAISTSFSSEGASDCPYQDQMSGGTAIGDGGVEDDDHAVLVEYSRPVGYSVGCGTNRQTGSSDIEHHRTIIAAYHCRL